MVVPWLLVPLVFLAVNETARHAVSGKFDMNSKARTLD